MTLVIDGFRKALQIDAVDASTNFFASGGGSLQVLLLQDFIKTDNGQRPSLRQKIEQHVFFSNPTVADIVELLVELASKFTDGANQSEAVSVQAGHVNSGGFYPASFQQEQMFILDASGFGAAYNMPWILDIKGKLNRELMLQALDLVVKREQPLRTILRLKGGNVQQKVLPKSDSRQLWECQDHFAGSYEDAIQILSEEQGYIFNVKQAPISRMNIVKLESDRSLVMVNGHHVNHDTVSIFIIFLLNVNTEYLALTFDLLIVMKWSTVNFRRCLLQTYVDLCAGQKKDFDESDREYDYLGWSLWQQAFVKRGSPEYVKQLKYWKNELQGASVVEFPRDKPLKSSRANQGKMITFELSPSVIRTWKEDLASQGCTIFMGGLTVLHLLLARWCNKDDIVTGAAVANRNIHPAYSERLGGYANIVTIRSNSGNDPSYSEMLQELRSRILGSWTAQDIPYHQVIAGIGDSDFRGFNVMYAM